MTESDMITLQDESAIITPHEAKSWQVVDSVLSWMAENGSYNYSEAFRATGVERWTYYRAIKVPFVQYKLAEQMDALDKAAIKILQGRWLNVLQNMALLAESDAREAVQAARFLANEKQRLQDISSGKTGQDGPSEAALILQKAKEGPKIVSARRTTVTEEVEFTPIET